MMGQQNGGIPSGKASNGAVDDEYGKLLHWTLKQTQLRYDEAQDRRGKLRELIERLLGFCAIFGFTTLLSKSIWENTMSEQRSARIVSIFFCCWL